MDTRTQQAVDRVYEDLEPYYEWARDEGRFTFMVPGTYICLLIQAQTLPSIISIY